MDPPEHSLHIAQVPSSAKKKPICWCFSLRAARRPLHMRLTRRRAPDNPGTGRRPTRRELRPAGGASSGRATLVASAALVAADGLVGDFGLIAAPDQEAPGAVALAVVPGRRHALLEQQ